MREGEEARLRVQERGEGGRGGVGGSGSRVGGDGPTGGADWSGMGGSGGGSCRRRCCCCSERGCERLWEGSGRFGLSGFDLGDLLPRAGPRSGHS